MAIAGVITLIKHMGKLPEKFRETTQLIAKRLVSTNYAIRGTASLVLQGLDMNADDIDVVGDKDMAEACNELLSDFLVKSVAYSESPKYKSYFGQFKINGILVEVYGNWEIKTPKGEWKKIEIERTLVDNVYVTTIQKELAMFAAMGRWTAYHKIKKQL